MFVDRATSLFGHKRGMDVASGYRDQNGRVARRARRDRLFLPIELRSATGVQSGYLLDLSTSGGQVRATVPPAAGTIVTLIAREVVRPARIAWVKDHRIGLAFVKPLTPGELVELVGFDPAARG